jgi:processive 1,2-diacylglycerol beta-glucosyltransferase
VLRKSVVGALSLLLLQGPRPSPARARSARFTTSRQTHPPTLAARPANPFPSVTRPVSIRVPDVRRGIQPLRILIVSATVGAGDAGNARELARRLVDEGHEAEVRDFLESPPLGIGKALSKGYEAELRHAPWAYELAFKIWFWLPFLLPPMARFLTFFTRKKVLSWVRETHADIVVSTYPVATQVLGELRRRAHRRWRAHSGLRVPAVNFITDFGFHPFWAHRGIDLNVAVSPGTVEAVGRRTGRLSIACGPLVSPQFSTAPERRSSERAQLGLDRDELAVLISSGSWGVGDLEETFELVANQPGLVPVVTCGRNSELRDHLEALAKAKGYRAHLFGWTDDMAGVMAACDVLVENAGGLTSFEAMSAGLPLVTFRPIPGHGRNSAAAMSAAGVSWLARNSEELVASLRRLGRAGVARAAQLAAAAALFSGDAAHALAEIGAFGVPPQPRLRPAARAARAASAAALAATISWVGLTGGVGVAAAAGIGVAHPPDGTPDVIYLGVRLSTQELPDPSVQTALARLNASAVVDVNTADARRDALKALASKGVDLESGGLSDVPGASDEPVAPWAVARSDSQSVQVLSGMAGVPVNALVPDRSISAFDLVDASAAHLLMVVPDTTMPVPPSGPFPQQELALPKLQGDQIYLVNGLRVTSGQLVVLLSNLEAQLSGIGLSSAPLSHLQ